MAKRNPWEGFGSFLKPLEKPDTHKVKPKSTKPSYEALSEELKNTKRVMGELLELVAYLDPGWNSLTTPSIVVEAVALVSGIK